jgi:hypothetical protein
MAEEIWYIALRKLKIPQGEGSVPSSLRLLPGQRFALDGDEPIDIESMIRVNAVKIYDEATDAEWAEEQRGAAREVATTRRRRTRGKTIS